MIERLMIERLDSNHCFLDNSDRLLSQERGLYARIQVRARMNTGFAKSTGNRIGAFLEANLVLLLFVIAVAGPASIAVAQSSGTFTATGNMITARAAHTATLLFNGKVLIAGGYQYGYPGAALASAELYDPSTGTFAPTGDMTVARVGPTATLLTDGRVLIAGGYGPLASAELYDPSTGTFTATGSMITPGPLHTATLLGNGKVLVAGGYPTAELYDPATGTFAVTGAYAGSYTGPLYVGTATLLLDGRVLITGSDKVAVPVTELYDPGTGTFSPAGTMSGAVGWWGNVNTATLLRNGTVLVVGSDEEDFPADAEVYDPSTGKFASIGNTAAPHEFSTATLLPDGTVLIAGSQDRGL
jgi:Kelch motif protein